MPAVNIAADALGQAVPPAIDCQSFFAARLLNLRKNVVSFVLNGFQDGFYGRLDIFGSRRFFGGNHVGFDFIYRVTDCLCVRCLALLRQRRIHLNCHCSTAGTAVLRQIVSCPASHKPPSGCQRYHLRTLLRLQYAAQRAGHRIYTLRQYDACYIASRSAKHRNRFAISAVKGCRNLIRGQIHRCTAVVHTDAPFVRTAVALHHHQVRPASRPGRMLEVNALLKRPLHCFFPPACG